MDDHVKYNKSNKCGDCGMLETEDGSPYCLMMDLYTERVHNDIACEYFVRKQTRKKKIKSDVGNIARLAREAGMSYGQYVAILKFNRRMGTVQ